MNSNYSIILGMIGGFTLLVIGIFLFTQSGGEPIIQGENPPGGEGDGAMALLVEGAACEQDTDCVYALNAYPSPQCVSTNCPPPEAIEQPEPGDPIYEWVDGYDPACVNANALNNQNREGEPLLLEDRETRCACQPIPTGDGVITSLTGSKICTVQ
ncbi:MAG: hypothetical protein AABW68_04815 [archaeon]